MNDNTGSMPHVPILELNNCYSLLNNTSLSKLKGET